MTLLSYTSPNAPVYLECKAVSSAGDPSATRGINLCHSMMRKHCSRGTGHCKAKPIKSLPALTCRPSSACLEGLLSLIGLQHPDRNAIYHCLLLPVCVYLPSPLGMRFCVGLECYSEASRVTPPAHTHTKTCAHTSTRMSQKTRLTNTD